MTGTPIYDALFDERLSSYMQWMYDDMKLILAGRDTTDHRLKDWWNR